MRKIAVFTTFSLMLACRSDSSDVKEGDTSHDYDGDGFSEDQGDCDDSDDGIHPDAIDGCDGVDNNCDGTLDDNGDIAFYLDSDNDGFGRLEEPVLACAPPAGYVDNSDDCDDELAAVYPNADERCDSIDNDCDGTIDEDEAVDAPLWYLDSDSDGFGVASDTINSCQQPDGYVDVDGDCDDSLASVYPDAPEVSNDGVDQDCDGEDREAILMDEVGVGDLVVSEIMHDPTTVEDYVGEWFEVYNTTDNSIDLQGLRFGSALDLLQTVSESLILSPHGYAVFASRALAAENGGIEEVHQVYDRSILRLDNAGTILLQKEDGTSIDMVSYNVITDFPSSNGASLTLGVFDSQSNDLGQSWCEASSVYGLGDLGTPGAANDECDLDGDGFPLSQGDCDDNNPEIHPFASEVCDGLDNDCDGAIDSADADVVSEPSWFLDADGDAYGDPDQVSSNCEQPTGYVSNDEDCDDSDAAINPETIWYLDFDSDGYGGSTISLESCTQPTDYVANSADCSDTDGTIYPGAGEICDGLDNDCDGDVDTDDSDITGDILWYADGDGDGFGDAQQATINCSQPTGYVADSTDCDDGTVAVNPDAQEVCDTIDNDCDGDIDDADSSVDLTAGSTTFYMDGDGDGYGDSSVSQSSCSQSLAGYASNPDDCDDTNAAIHPMADEVCDSIDNDCDGNADDADDVIVGGTAYYADLDGDGFGDPQSSIDACVQPQDYILDAQDCDDGDEMVKPGEREACDDGIDNNCDGDFSSNYCSFELGNLGANGYDFDGASSVAQPIFGYTVSHAGDVNNDGNMDLAIGARLADEGGGTGSGATYVYYGPINQSLDTTQADAVLAGGLDDKSSYIISGGTALKGGIVSDIDGDGNDDLLVSAITNDLGGSDSGAIYIQYGPISGPMDLTSSADSILYGESIGDQLGRGASIVGDVNGDGNADVIVGAYKHDGSGTDSGSAYLLLGPIGSGAVNVEAALSLYGDVDYGLGYATAGPGDVNGDGFDDALISAYRADGTDPVSGLALANNGKTYLFHGGTSPSWNLNVPDASFEGVTNNDKSGYVLSGAGDVDNDGLQDVLIGAPHADVDGDVDGGAAYLVTGNPSSDIHLSNATAIFLRETAFGPTDSMQFGRSVSAAGDLDGDGYDDLIIGAKKSDRNGTDSGAAYVYFGPLTGTYRAPHAVISGEVAGDEAGIAVVGLSDVTGGNRSDLLIGAYKHNNIEGAAYLFTGESF